MVPAYSLANGRGSERLIQSRDRKGAWMRLRPHAFCEFNMPAYAGVLRHPFVEYYRWFSNNMGGAPGTDPWKVDV